MQASSETVFIISGIIAFALLLLISAKALFGIVIIDELEVGIVIKKISVKKLEAGKLIALNGEAGYQADTLAPGWHFYYWPWMYKVIKERVIMIPQGEIGLIVAKAGESILGIRLRPIQYSIS